MTEDAEATLAALRDSLRSARRPGELLTRTDRARVLATIARVGLGVARDLGHPARDLDIGDAAAPAAPCPVERLAFLARIVPQVIAATDRLEREPPSALCRTERVVPTERARHIGASALRRLVQSPHTRTVAETAHVPTRDTPANRAVKTILATFARDLKTVADLAQNAGLPGAFAGAETVRRRLHLVLRRVVWRDLPVLPTVPSLPATLRKSAAHVLLHDAYRRYRSGFAWDWAHPLFHLSERETWQIYEAWCFFAVVETLQTMGFRVTNGDAVHVTPSGISLSLATDAASRLTFRRGSDTVTATFQRRFDRGDTDTSGYHSRAGALVPDIVLESAGRLLVLDAKFKTYAEPGDTGAFLAPVDDMRQMHSYRDAVRRPDDSHPVVAAWCVYAGRAIGANRAVVAFPQSSPQNPFGNGEVGAILLRPGVGADTLAALIERFLHPASTSALSTHDRAR